MKDSLRIKISPGSLPKNRIFGPHVIQAPMTNSNTPNVISPLAMSVVYRFWEGLFQAPSI